MTKFLIRRSLLTLLMLFGLLTITFFISRISPGDPAALAAGPDASAEMIDKIRKEYGLDRPIIEQYLIYVKKVLQGDWGKSIHSTHEVLIDLVEYFPATFELVLVSISFAIVLGVPMGITAAIYQNRFIDHFIRIISVSGVAMPMFCLGLLLQYFVALQLNMFPLGGQLKMMTDPPESVTHLILLDSLIEGNLEVFIEALHHICLPALSLSFPALASIIRVNRSEMLETLKQDYIVTARAYSISLFRTVAIYALRNAMLPTLAMIGLRFGWMLGGTVLIESVFDWPGIGLYAVDSAINSDFEPIIGTTIVLGFMFMIINLIIDLVYSYLDPRVRDQI